jgi:hypothetical protein
MNIPLLFYPFLIIVALAITAYVLALFIYILLGVLSPVIIALAWLTYWLGELIDRRWGSGKKGI